MNKKQCEKLILEKLKEIGDIYLQYNPKGDYLNLCFMKDEDNELYFSFNNSYAEKDQSKPINFTRFEKDDYLRRK